jgi:small redox-active disulfide protein 2
VKTKGKNMQLTVIGSGCTRCKTLAQFTEQAAKKLGVPYDMNKVTDLKQIMALGVMITPALAINGTVKVAGRVPSVEEIKKLLA